MSERLNREFLVNLFGSENILYERTYIEIRDTKINKIDSNAFKGLTNLEVLVLDNNEIEEIGANAFKDLSNLLVLMLNKNKFKRVDSNTWSGLTRLLRLQLNQNYIEEIKGNSFSGLSSLRGLYLDNNKLKKIDSNALKGLSNLEKLNLSRNEIDEIHNNTFKGLSSLRELNLGSNKLKRIESNTLKELIELEIVDLSMNEIEEIENNTFEGLSNLKQLKFNNNKVKNIDPNCFDKLNSIKALYLYKNNVKLPSFLSSSILFFNPFVNDLGESINMVSYYKIEEYEFHSDWNKFLEHVHIICRFQTTRLLISDYYDFLINGIDICTEMQLENYTENDLLPNETENAKYEIKFNNEYETEYEIKNRDVEFFEIKSLLDANRKEYKYVLKNQLTNVTPGLTKARDYLNLVRSNAIEVVNRLREETLKRYSIERDKYQFIQENMTTERVCEMRRELFKESFCFLLKINNMFLGSDLIPNKFVIIRTNFYMDDFDVHELNGMFDIKKRTYYNALMRRGTKILTILLAKYIRGLLNTQVYGNEVISITEETLLNIERFNYIFDIRHFYEKNIRNLRSHLCGSDRLDFSNIKSLGIQNKKATRTKRYKEIDLSAFKNLENLYILNSNHSLIAPTDSKFLSPLTKLQILEIDYLNFPINLDGLENLKVLFLTRLEDFDLLQNLGNKLIGLSILSRPRDLNESVYHKTNIFFERQNFSSVTHLKLQVKQFNPEWLHSFNSLKRLSLQLCDLKSTDFLQSINLPQIEYLDLSFNHISNVKSGTFSKFNSLKYLNISNQTTLMSDKAEKNVFYGLNNLKTLTMSLNFIDSIDPEVFTNTPTLTHLDLREYHFNRNECILEENTFKHLKHLEKIVLNNSAFNRINSRILDTLRKSNIEITIKDSVDY